MPLPSPSAVFLCLVVVSVQSCQPRLPFSLCSSQPHARLASVLLPCRPLLFSYRGVGLLPSLRHCRLDAFPSMPACLLVLKFLPLRTGLPACPEIPSHPRRPACLS